MDYKEKVIALLNSQELSKEQKESLEAIFPELKGGEDERIRKDLKRAISFAIERSFFDKETANNCIAWLEKQRSEPNWCHHKVDLSDCSEEYRKAYYDGWNNCNMQHSQCKSEGNDVVKCLINGMKFYYEDNEEATWGTEKFSMKVKDILSWLEKQGTCYTKMDIDDAYLKGVTNTKNEIEKQYEANYQIRKDIATFIFNYKGDIKDRDKWIDYLGIKVSFVEEQNEQKETLCDTCRKAQPSHSCQDITALGRCALEKQGEQKSAELSHPKATKISDQVQKPAESKQETKPNGGIVCEDFNEGDGYYKVNLAYLSKSQVELIENLVASWQTSANNSVEWSEEDEGILRTIISDGIRGAGFDMLQIDWLKSIKQRHTWKPSEKQMDAVKDAIDYLGGNTKIVRKYLMSLYEDLKKLLREE